MIIRPAIRKAAAAILPAASLTWIRAVLAMIGENKLRQAGQTAAESLVARRAPNSAPCLERTNPLEAYFDSHTTGPGIWKWRHYFHAYHRHLSKFIGCKPRILEIGIYSGGSLEMWRQYFGKGCTIIGVDIESACMEYARDDIEIHIGDQGDPEFWTRFVLEVPPVDVVIDDGGHRFEQQRETLVRLLPHLREGGVYICEDVHGASNPLLPFLEGCSRQLHGFSTADDNGVWPMNSLQQLISSVHQYPYLFVIETGCHKEAGFSAPKRGSQWQPFLDPP